MGTLQQTLQGTQIAGAGNREYNYQEKVAQTVIAQINAYYDQTPPPPPTQKPAAAPKESPSVYKLILDGCNVYRGVSGDAGDYTDSLIVEVPNALVQIDQYNFGPVYVAILSTADGGQFNRRLTPSESYGAVNDYNATVAADAALDYKRCFVLQFKSVTDQYFSAIVSGTLAPKTVTLDIPA